MIRKHLTRGRPVSAQARRRRPADRQVDHADVESLRDSHECDPVVRVKEHLDEQMAKLRSLLDRIGRPPGGVPYGRRSRLLLRQLSDTIRRNAEGANE